MHATIPQMPTLTRGHCENGGLRQFFCILVTLTHTKMQQDSPQLYAAKEKGDVLHSPDHTHHIVVF